MPHLRPGSGRPSLFTRYERWLLLAVGTLAGWPGMQQPCLNPRGQHLRLTPRYTCSEAFKSKD